MSVPKVSFNGIGYEITLFRSDATGAMKEEKITFGDHRLSVCKSLKDCAQGRTRAPLIKGPPADDGFFYYLYAQPEAHARPTYIWLQNEEEFLALSKAIKDAEDANDAYWRKDTKCTFCGSMYSECGGDHGDEMREIQREALRND